jgi:DNA-binding GntR family transcriptional regulator
VSLVAGQLSEDDLDLMRAANRRFAAALTAGDVAAAHDADDELHRIPVVASGNAALASVIDHFDPLVRRAERQQFSRDGRLSVERHDQLIALLAAGDVTGAAAVAFDIWHNLPTEEPHG